MSRALPLPRILIASVALAAPAARADCPDVAALVESAFELYQQAELAAAESHVSDAYTALGCQVRPLPTEDLLALYRLDGLIALSVEDTKSLVFATIRAVAADHVTGRPPDRYGPELQAQFDTWAARLAEDRVIVRVVDEGTVWVDGRSVDAHHPLEVVAGEHLVQLPVPGGDAAGPTVRSEVRELAGDATLLTGVGQVVAMPVPVPLPVPMPAPSPMPAPAARPLPDLDAAPTEPRRRRPLALAIAGAATGVAAGVTLVSAYRSDLLFRASPYQAASYHGCDQDDACWASARARTIRVDARKIDIMYGVGYGLAAVSGGFVVVTAVGLPPRPR